MAACPERWRLQRVWVRTQPRTPEQAQAYDAYRTHFKICQVCHAERVAMTAYTRAGGGNARLGEKEKPLNVTAEFKELEAAKVEAKDE